MPLYLQDYEIIFSVECMSLICDLFALCLQFFDQDPVPLSALPPALD